MKNIFWWIGDLVKKKKNNVQIHWKNDVHLWLMKQFDESQKKKTNILLIFLSIINFYQMWIKSTFERKSNSIIQNGYQKNMDGNRNYWEEIYFSLRNKKKISFGKKRTNKIKKIYNQE